MTQRMWFKHRHCFESVPGTREASKNSRDAKRINFFLRDAKRFTTESETLNHPQKSIIFWRDRRASQDLMPGRCMCNSPGARYTGLRYSRSRRGRRTVKADMPSDDKAERYGKIESMTTVQEKIQKNPDAFMKERTEYQVMKEKKSGNYKSTLQEGSKRRETDIKASTR